MATKERDSGGRRDLLDGLEREKGVEPSLSAWEADVLPLNYSRSPTLLVLH